MSNDQQAVRSVQQFRNRITRRFDIEPVSSLTPKELEDLDAVSIYERWTDDKGRVHVRVFGSRAA
jgi:hypothetical protein